MTEAEYHNKLGKLCKLHYSELECDEVWFHHKLNKLYNKYQNEKKKNKITRQTQKQ